MPRPRTGTLVPLRRSDGTKYYRARIRLEDGTRDPILVPEKYSYSEERARLYAAAAQEREDETGELMAKKRARQADATAKADPRHGETCEAYFFRL